jgi:hypothetical protein
LEFGYDGIVVLILCEGEMVQSAMINIGKMIKAVVVSSATTAFLCSGLMLCCQVGIVHAEQLKSKTAACCHASKTNHLKDQDAKSCSCCKISKDSPDQATKIFEITKPFGKFFSKIFLTVERLVHIPHDRASFLLAYHGPPRADTSIPIYLRFSNLRI